MSRCGGVRPLLHREAVGLTEAERILLEEHLETCTACQRSREQLGLARELVNAMPLDPLNATAHQRALAKAMLRGSEPHIQRRAWAPFAIVCGALACATVFALWFATREKAPLERLPAPIAVAPAARVIDGDLATPSGIVAPGSALPADTLLSSTGEARISLPATHVKLAAETAVRWSNGELGLERGAIDVEVDPAAQSRVRVVTPGFVVEVTGTAFRVTLRDVAVDRGSVRVLALDGALLAELGAGERWSVDEPAGGPSVGEPAGGPSVGEPAGVPNVGESVAPPVVPARVLLDRAVRAFAARNCTAAEQHADAALDAAPTRREAAEARTLLAECAQVGGRLDEAVRRYDAIATRFADLPAGQTAAIAAARIELARGKRDDARERYQRYLDRFPTGRFVDDARRQLQALEP